MVTHSGTEINNVIAECALWHKGVDWPRQLHEHATEIAKVNASRQSQRALLPYYGTPETTVAGHFSCTLEHQSTRYANAGGTKR